MKNKSFFIALFIFMQCIFGTAFAGSLSVDSIGNLIKGDWYGTYQCNGVTGKCDSTFSTIKNVITPKAGTDTIQWITYADTGVVTENFKLKYSADQIGGDSTWKMSLLHNDTITYLGNLVYIINSATNKSLTLQRNAYQGETTTYAHTAHVETAIQKSTDSIASLISGDWYLTTICYNPVSAPSWSKTFYNSNKTSISHITGSDSISWSFYNSSDILSSTSILKIRPNDIFSGTNGWILEDSNGNPNYIINIDIYGLSMEEAATDGNSYSYSHTKLTNGISLTESDNLGFSISPNLVKSDIQISGSNDIESIKVISSKGNTVKSVTGNIHSINVSDYGTGIYFVNIKSKGKIQTIKIVKE